MIDCSKYWIFPRMEVGIEGGTRSVPGNLKKRLKIKQWVSKYLQFSKYISSKYLELGKKYCVSTMTMHKIIELFILLMLLITTLQLPSWSFLDWKFIKKSQQCTVWSERFLHKVALPELIFHQSCNLSSTIKLCLYPKYWKSACLWS